MERRDHEAGGQCGISLGACDPDFVLGAPESPRDSGTAAVRSVSFRHTGAGDLVRERVPYGLRADQPGTHGAQFRTALASRSASRHALRTGTHHDVENAAKTLPAPGRKRG